MEMPICSAFHLRSPVGPGGVGSSGDSWRSGCDPEVRFYAQKSSNFSMSSAQFLI
jgi:hypothetical protein